MKSVMESRRSVIKLVLAMLGVGAFFIPLGALPFGITLSLYDLLSGALSGGVWRPARVGSLLLFIGAVVFLVAAARKVFRAGHESVA